MCEICAPRVCYTVTLITEPYTPPGGTDGTTGTQIPIGSSSYGGSGNSGDNTGGNYLNQCNPNIPPGTNVASNQLPPCSIYTPVTVLNPNFTSTTTVGRFVLSMEDQAKYPRFTEVVRNIKLMVLDDPNLMAGLQIWTGLSEQRYYPI